MLLVIGKSGFAGEAPRMDASRLAEVSATHARNCDLRQDDLRPMMGLSEPVATLSLAGAVRTLYRYGQRIVSDSLYWWGFLDETNVVRGLVAGDTLERTYWTTAGDVPRCTDWPHAITAAPYPTTTYAVGVPPPEIAPEATVVGEADTSETPVSRLYMEVFVSEWSAGVQEPSAASPNSTLVTVYPGQSVELQLLAPMPSGSYVITKRQLYRTDSGTEGNFRLVAELPIAQTSFIDEVADTALGGDYEAATWLPPPEGLRNLVAMPNGIMAGTDGFDVVLSEPYRPFAWPNRVPLGEAPVALGVTGGQLVAVTRGRPYLISGADPANMYAQDLAVAQAGRSARSLVDMRYGLVYAGTDGLVLVTPDGQAVIVTEAILSGEQWRAMVPVDGLHAYRDGARYVAFLDAGGGFEIDPRNPARTFVRHDITARAGFVEPSTGELYVTDTDNCVRRWGGGLSLIYVWRSKRFELPRPLRFARAQITADGPVTMRIYADDVLRFERLVSDAFPVTLPDGFLARYWQIELEGSARVQWLALAQSVTELRNV